jgi:hypothetical protein
MPASMAYKTLFLQNLPEQITPADIKRFFVQNIKLARKFEPSVEKIGCIYAAPGETRKRTVVTFSSKRVAQEALTLSQLREISAEGAPLSLESGRSTVEIDSSFEGLTILFEPDSRAANIEYVVMRLLHPVVCAKGYLTCVLPTASYCSMVSLDMLGTLLRKQNLRRNTGYEITSQSGSRVGMYTPGS